jgi:hypothetical protein
MTGHGFGMHIPEWVSPVLTFAIIGFFFWKSVRAIKQEPRKTRTKTFK